MAEAPMFALINVLKWNKDQLATHKQRNGHEREVAHFNDNIDFLLRTYPALTKRKIDKAA